MPNNKNSDHILPPDERGLYTRSAFQALQRIYGECLAKYEEEGNLDSQISIRVPSSTRTNAKNNKRRIYLWPRI